MILKRRIAVEMWVSILYFNKLAVYIFKMKSCLETAWPEVCQASPHCRVGLQREGCTRAALVCMCHLEPPEHRRPGVGHSGLCPLGCREGAPWWTEVSESSARGQPVVRAGVPSSLRAAFQPEGVGTRLLRTLEPRSQRRGAQGLAAGLVRPALSGGRAPTAAAGPGAGRALPSAPRTAPGRPAPGVGGRATGQAALLLDTGSAASERGPAPRPSAASASRSEPAGLGRREPRCREASSRRAWVMARGARSSKAAAPGQSPA